MLSDKLKNLSSYPFHMPGHKRQSGLSLFGEEIDVTEIDDLDNLHSPTAVIKELEDKLSRLYKAKRSIISVNGSTCGVLSAISAVCKKGGEIIIAANCHKSVFNACEINDLTAHIITPEYNGDFACFGKITQQSVDEALKEFPNACAVVITSPTYEGVVSKIKCDIPLIIDSAHGAHFGFADWLPEREYGDIVITSLHKTLPSLTQTALVNIYNEKLFSSVKRYMDIFETSSPSYVLLDSVCKCAAFLDRSGDAFAGYKKRLDAFYEKVAGLDNIHILNNDDLTRIIICADGYTGKELSDALRKDFNIEAEGATLKYVILISTVCDSEYGFELLLNALSSLEKRKRLCFNLPKPAVCKTMHGAFSADETAALLLDRAVGKICAEYVYAYPPGAPLLFPGEIITDEIVHFIKTLLENDVNVLSDSSLLPLKILTKR